MSPSGEAAAVIKVKRSGPVNEPSGEQFYRPDRLVLTEAVNGVPQGGLAIVIVAPSHSLKHQVEQRPAGLRHSTHLPF